MVERCGRGLVVSFVKGLRASVRVFLQIEVTALAANTASLGDLDHFSEIGLLSIQF